MAYSPYWRVEEASVMRRRGKGYRFFLGSCLLLFFAGGAARAFPGLENGKALYTERCALCHGEKGEGWDWNKKVMRPPVPVPDLREVVPQRSDAYLLAVIRDGGKAVGLTSFMPAFGFDMSEQDLKDVVAYLRLLSQRNR
ncbi:MAG: cytochrome c [Nitrospinota bacterium]|nr:MAG: cytochrome c [Nitrospinota bacterium]